MTDLEKKAIKMAFDAAEPAMRSAIKKIEELRAENKALRQALAQPEQESVGTYGEVTERMITLLRGTVQQMEVYEHFKNIPLYTAPPKREWQGLTDEDIDEVERWVDYKEEGSGPIPLQKLTRYIEAKLKEKNT